MRLGFAQPGSTDFQYLTTPKSAQMITWALNRIKWTAGDDSGMFETGTSSTGWRTNTAGYAQQSILFPVLVGPGTNGSGVTTSPLDPAGAANPTSMTLADVTAGVWDTLFSQGLTNLATYLPNATLRVGDEWYGSSWYPWNGPAQGAAGKVCYQHLVTLARSINSGFTYEWNGAVDLGSNGGYSFADVQNFYPGDSYVDYLSGDPYDSTTGTAGQAGWDARVTQMGQGLTFAQAHGKPYCITEWGLFNVAQMGNGNDDDYAFIQAAYSWMRGNSSALGWATFFQNPSGWQGALQANPQSAAVFKSLFGGWAQQLMGRTSHRFLSSGTNRVRVK